MDDTFSTLILRPARNRPEAGSLSVSRPTWSTLALALLVAGSAFTRFYFAVGLREPWIAPDEMVYALSGRSFWETGHLGLLGSPAPFYGFYPLFVGLPLAVLGVGVGLLVLQAAQTVLMSLAGVVVFVWARRLVGPRWALAAAAMTLASPALARSGEVMSEAAFFPLMTLALWLLARALASPTRASQLAAGAAVTATLAVRFQGVGLIGVVCLGAALVAWLERDLSSIRRFRPLALSISGGVALLYATRLAIGGSPSVLGAYTESVSGGYHLTSVLTWSMREAADLFLIVLGLPLLAAANLLISSLRRRQRDREVSALLAVTFGYCTVTVVQVGAFASENVHRLAERDLVTAGPPLFVTLAVWLGRGLPRAQPWAAICAFMVTIPAILLPVASLATPAAFPDGFSLAPLLDLAQRTTPHTLTAAWAIGAAAVVVVAVFAPARAAALLVLLLIFGLGGTSVLAERMLANRTLSDRSEFFGEAVPNWIDSSVSGGVVYLDDGDPLWNGVWQQAFWNKTLRTAATLTVNPAAPLFGERQVRARPDGRLHLPGGPDLDARYVVAPTRLTLVGRRLQSIRQGRDEPGLTLWRTSGVPRLATRTIGVLPHNDHLANPIQMTVFDCTAGTLDLTVIAQQGVIGLRQGTPSVRISVTGLKPTEVVVNPGHVWHLEVAAPRADDGSRARRCVFRIVAIGEVSQTRLAFTRHPAAGVGGSPSFRLARSGHTQIVGFEGRRVGSAPPIGLCVDRHLVMVDPTGAARTLALHDHKLARVVKGQGLTCDPPPTTDTQQGFAPSSAGIPGGVYEYYAPAPR